MNPSGQAGYGRFLQPNHSSKIPRTHIVLDSEAIITPDATGETHTFRCAVTSCDKMSRHGDWWQQPEYAEHDTPEGVWKWISDRTTKRERTVVVAHNVGYDLRICEAFTVLPTLGWNLGMFSLAPGATWTTWKRESATLSIVDSLSWLPTNLANLGRTLNLDKPTLPGVDDGIEQWLDRCRSDVTILRRAWLDIIQWLRDNDCGNWKPTGAGMAFAAFRHRHLTHRILTHSDVDQRVRERRAAWTGRAEPWRFGNQSNGPFYEWDYTCAYASIAGDSNVPTRLIGEVELPDRSWRPPETTRKAYLCEVEVTTELPLVPCSYNGAIVWPVGTFKTTLWSNELALLTRYGQSYSTQRSWVYRTEPALKSWSEWVLKLTHDQTGTTPPIIRILAKHWCRALIGRFGSRFPVWEPYGDARNAGTSLSGYTDLDTMETGQLLEVGGSAFRALGMTDHPMACPQIMSWIMAESRVRLWTAIETAGRENVLYVDTDSLIVNRDGSAALTRSAIPDLRKKAEYRTLDIIGTRRLIENQTLKAAGVPRGAIRTGRNTWSGESWSSMAVDLAGGNTGTVRVSERTVSLLDRDARRYNPGDGTSEPYRIGMT